MRIWFAERLRQLAHKVDPEHSARRGLEAGRKWGEEMMAGVDKVLTVNHHLTLPALDAISTKVMLDSLGRALSASPKDPDAGK